MATSYVDLISELARASRERAQARARGLLAAAGLEEAAADAGERAGRLADEMWQASRANRRLVQNLVDEERGRAAERWGLARTEDLDDLRREIDELRVALIKATLDPPPAVRRRSESPARRLGPRVRPKTRTPRRPATA